MLSFPEVCSLLVSLDEKMGRIAAAQDVNPWQLGSILFSVPIHMPSVLMTSLLINNAFAFRSTHVFLASKWWERRDFARQWKDRLFRRGCCPTTFSGLKLDRQGFLGSKVVVLETLCVQIRAWRCKTPTCGRMQLTEPQRNISNREQRFCKRKH